MSEHEPRTIAVTGSASGIGAATAARLEKAGHRVIRVDWKGGDVIADLGTPAGRAAAVEGVRRAAGASLDGLVSGAGLGPYDEPRAIVRVNYFGAVAVLDGLRDLLARGREPAAVAISSIGALFEPMHVAGFAEACLAGDEARALALTEGRDGNSAYTNAKHALALAVPQARGRRGALRACASTPCCPARSRRRCSRRSTRTRRSGRWSPPCPSRSVARAAPEELAAAIAFLLCARRALRARHDAQGGRRQRRAGAARRALRA